MCTSATRKNRLSDVIPYTLPQLHTGKTWYVDFFCFDPVVGAMKRKKYHLDPYKTISERKGACNGNHHQRDGAAALGLDMAFLNYACPVNALSVLFVE